MTNLSLLTIPEIEDRLAGAKANREAALAARRRKYHIPALDKSIKAYEDEIFRRTHCLMLADMDRELDVIIIDQENI